MRNPLVQLSEIKVSLDLPFVGSLEGTWQPDESERMAAWEMYVELVTRIAVMPLGEKEGLLREALSSLHSLFDTTRKILREHGPTVARTKKDGDLSFGILAVAVLNTAVRPVLSQWHPRLMNYELQKPASISPSEWESQWEFCRELRVLLDETRLVLIAYAHLLGAVAEVPSLIIDPSSS